MPRKKADEPKLTLERILETAYELFAKEGYEGTTLNALSKLLGVSKPALYYYFDSKESLFEALYQSTVNVIKADLGQVLKQAQADFMQSRTRESFKKIIYTLGINDFEGLASDPSLAKVLRQFDLLSLRQPSIHLIANELENFTREIHTALFDLALDAELYSESEITYLKATIYALINGFNYELIFENRQIDPKAWQFALDRIL